MNEDDVRAKSDEVGAALVAGDVERVIAAFSDELKRNLGEVVALLPLPAREANVQSVDRGGSGFVVVTRVIGETDEVELQLRWKDRNGEPRIVEVSHLSRKVREQEAIDELAALEGEADSESQGGAEAPEGQTA
jgi:hypothetical protein